MGVAAVVTLSRDVFELRSGVAALRGFFRGVLAVASTTDCRSRPTRGGGGVSLAAPPAESLASGSVSRALPVESDCPVADSGEADASGATTRASPEMVIADSQQATISAPPRCFIALPPPAPAPSPGDANIYTFLLLCLYIVFGSAGPMERAAY
jgi:hypothetical protein